MARPSSYTPKKGKAFIAKLEEGVGVKLAADEVGVTRKTAYNWAEQYPEFGEEFENTQEGITDAIEQTLIQKALAGDVTACIFLTKTRRRHIYGDKQTLEHTGEGGKPFTIVIEQPKDA